MSSVAAATMRSRASCRLRRATWRLVVVFTGAAMDSLTQCDTDCYPRAVMEDRRGSVRTGRAAVALIAAALIALLAASPAAARPVGAGTGNQPNILVVMTDDEALADLQHMPHVRK